MHLSPNTKKRHAAAHGYATQLAARSSRSSLITALIGAVAVQAGIPPLDRMQSVCCKGTCFNKKDCPGAACIMAVGGYSHLEQIHAEHLGTEPDLKPRQKKHKGTFGGYVKARGPVAARNTCPGPRGGSPAPRARLVRKRLTSRTPSSTAPMP